MNIEQHINFINDNDENHCIPWIDNCQHCGISSPIDEEDNVWYCLHCNKKVIKSDASWITIEEALARGCTLEPEICPYCDGFGEIVMGDGIIPCSNCD